MSSGPVTTVDGVALRGVVSAVPGPAIPNARFEDRFCAEAVAEVAKMTGVEARHWVKEGQTAADLCFDAASRLLTALDWAPESVDALIFVTQTPDQRMPAGALLLHGRLGLPVECAAFDVGLGCSGYTYGLWLAAIMVQSGRKRVLLCAGDTISPLLGPDDRGTVMLFGDAGTATAIEADPTAKPMRFVLRSDGKGAGAIVVTGGGFRAPGEMERLEMAGPEVFAFTLRAVPAMVTDVLAGDDPASIDAYAFHQANRFIIQNLIRKLKLAPEAAPVNIDRFGNTSMSSIPLLMTTDLSARLTSEPTRLVAAGFGVGLSWGAALLDLEPLAVAETIAA
ncbi:hypothetical protein ASG17_05005 [Brevundimonas sp. Leaf363]|uniref:ketoacyl-ACP synthase III n=1 Tax=Brevundimonas sp. Leaf363 TaxID=1736353 RepID=UPI0006F4B242|nr:ketoacyl-ACP synthase III [Brevundimonas sp. Leaf363]KQS55448.1 hypothetical protein ASG17_05005 [Brevundimonas sp. Leaf363]